MRNRSFGYKDINRYYKYERRQPFRYFLRTPQTLMVGRSIQRDHCRQYRSLPTPKIRLHETLRLQSINKKTLPPNPCCPIISKQTHKIPNILQSRSTFLTKVLRHNGEIVAVMFSMDYVIYYNNITHLFEQNQYYALYKDISI